MGYSIEHYNKFDPNFESDLKESQPYVELAAEWLRKVGCVAEVQPLKVRPDASKMGDYADDGDIHLIRANGKTARAEVKHRGLHFTSLRDYPYPTVIVDNAHTFDNAKKKPELYVIINKLATHGALIRVEFSRHAWVKTVKMDRGKNRNRTLYECPKELCEFFDFAAPHREPGMEG